MFKPEYAKNTQIKSIWLINNRKKHDFFRAHSGAGAALFDWILDYDILHWLTKLDIYPLLIIYDGLITTSYV